MTDYSKELFEIMKDHNISFNYNETTVNNVIWINNIAVVKIYQLCSYITIIYLD